MVSNNVWVEATVHPESAKDLDLGWNGVAEPLSQLHITMAFTTLNADSLGSDQFVGLCDRLAGACADLPNLLDDEITVGGAAILNPTEGAFGVLLLRSHLLWSHHTALARELTKTDELDLTYPGWLPHITLCTDVTNYGDIEVLHKLARSLYTTPIKLDGIWLRAGRMCLPL